MTLIDFLGNLLGALPILIAVLALGIANQKRTERVRQFPMPAVALGYAVMAMVLLYQANQQLNAALSSLAQGLPILGTVYSPTSLYAFENILVIIGFFLFKLLLKPVFAVLFRGPSFPGHRMVGGIYEWDADYGQWFVRPSSANLRGLYRGFLVAGVVVTAVYTALILTFPYWEGASAIAYPALIALVIGEVVWFLSGLTREEYVTDILGEDDDATRVTNYGLLRGVLGSTFEGRVLTEEISLSTMDATRSRSRIDRLIEDPVDDMESLAGAYFRRLKEDGQHLDVNLLEAAVGLLRGQSVVIANPFHDDLTPYLAFPAYHHLLQHRKVLIVAGRDSATTDYRDWIEAGLESITGIAGLWAAEVLGATRRDDLDVGVLRFADLHNVDLLRENDAFLEQVEFVILAEPSRLLATGQLGLGLVMQRVGRSRDAVYAAFDRNHDGLVDALSHLLKVELADVVASALPTGATSQLVWRADGPSMHTAILPAITRYLGMGTEIAAVALKYQVERVSWVGADRFPVRDMTWVAGQYYATINAFAEIDVTQVALTEAIAPVASPWSVPQADLQFLVVEDEINNIFESLRLYATRARTEGFVNLIAGDYLLRDYMVANREIFAADPKAIPSIVPDFARTERNGVLRLLLTMFAFDVTDAEFAKQLQILGVEVSDLSDESTGQVLVDDEPTVLVFKELVHKHTGIANVQIIGERDGDAGGPTAMRYRVAGSEELDAMLEHLRAAYFFVEEEREASAYVGALLYGHVYQAMLPGQFLTYGGKYYEVQSIGRAHEREGVVLRRAADHIRDRRVYRQIRTFRLDDFEVNPAAGARLTVDKVEAQPQGEGFTHANRIEVTRSFATVRVETHGYLEMASRSALSEARRIGVEDVPAREYRHKEVLEIRLPEIAAATRRTIVTVLNELFVSVFPNAYEYLTAVTTDEGDEFGDLLDDLEVDGRADSIFIVEDSLVDLGLIVAVERNWRRLLEIVTDYLLWRETPVPPETEPTVTVVEPVFPPSPPQKPGFFTRVARAVRRVARAVLGAVALISQPSVRRPPAASGESADVLPDRVPTSSESEEVLVAAEVEEEPTASDVDEAPGETPSAAEEADDDES